MVPDWVAHVTVGQVLLWLAVPALIGWGLRMSWPWLSRLKNLLDDFLGEPGRAGVDPRPGLMDRMKAVETSSAAALEAATAAKESADDAKHNTEPNDGSSSHDALVKRLDGISGDVAASREEIADTRAEVAEIRQDQVEQTRLTSEHRAESDQWRADLTARAAERGFDVPAWPAQAEQAATIAHLAEALPIIARSTPPEETP